MPLSPQNQTTLDAIDGILQEQKLPENDREQFKGLLIFLCDVASKADIESKAFHQDDLVKLGVEGAVSACLGTASIIPKHWFGRLLSTPAAVA